MREMSVYGSKVHMELWSASSPSPQCIRRLSLRIGTSHRRLSRTLTDETPVRLSLGQDAANEAAVQGL